MEFFLSRFSGFSLELGDELNAREKHIEIAIVLTIFV